MKMINATFKIEAKNVEKAYDALKNLSESKKAPNLQLAIQAFGWHVRKDTDGNFGRIKMVNTNADKTKKLFDKLAPFVGEGNYVITADEDDKETTWDFAIKKKATPKKKEEPEVTMTYAGDAASK